MSHISFAIKNALPNYTDSAINYGMSKMTVTTRAVFRDYYFRNLGLPQILENMQLRWPGQPCSTPAQIVNALDWAEKTFVERLQIPYGEEETRRLSARHVTRESVTGGLTWRV